ncbi:MAG: hypothetical protein JOY67_15790 [Hyphomicrobiales bacterium]|nr:hypothetical protein [Hyphomicrobiales bacterium]MBV9517628.1 hypothetical protein [Hyphomicrobiales bacterium]
MSRPLPFSVLLALSLVSPALAGVKTVEVRSEIETPIEFHPVVLGETCKFGVVPHIVITKPPVNGALLVKTEVVRIPDSAPVCSGKVVRAAVIYYKSVVGYRGTDSFSYEEVPDSGQSVDIDINIK